MTSHHQWLSFSSASCKASRHQRSTKRFYWCWFFWSRRLELRPAKTRILWKFSEPIIWFWWSNQCSWSSIFRECFVRQMSSLVNSTNWWKEFSIRSPVNLVKSESKGCLPWAESKDKMTRSRGQIYCFSIMSSRKEMSCLNKLLRVKRTSLALSSKSFSSQHSELTWIYL